MKCWFFLSPHHWGSGFRIKVSTPTRRPHKKVTNLGPELLLPDAGATFCWLSYFLSGRLWPDTKQEHCFQALSTDTDSSVKTETSSCSVRISVCLREATYREPARTSWRVTENCSCRWQYHKSCLVSLDICAKGIKHQQCEPRNVFHKENSCFPTHLLPWCVYSFGWCWFLILSTFKDKI